jgi:hypothetical protein
MVDPRCAALIMAWAVKLRLMTIVPFATQNSENIALPMG